jgi:hypothetical protein
MLQKMLKCSHELGYIVQITSKQIVTHSIILRCMYGMHQAVCFLIDLLSMNGFDTSFLSTKPTERTRTEWCQKNKLAFFFF